MKLNVILVFRTINSIELQGIHFYIIDIYVSGNEGVKSQKALGINVFNRKEKRLNKSGLLFAIFCDCI